MTTNNSNLFEHRFDTTQAHDTISVQDTFAAMVDHVQGVLMLLFTQFDGDKGRVSDAVMQNSIDSVLCEISDMKAVINAHFDAVKAGKEGGV